MKRIVCEMCGGSDLLKTEGVFVCQSCGTKYTVEEAKKMMVEVAGTVDVSGSTVKLDTSDRIQNLLRLARRAKDENNAAEAKKYYEMVLLESPDEWEPSFYTAFYSYWEAPITKFAVSLAGFAERAKTTVKMIFDSHSEGYSDSLKSMLESAEKVYLHAARLSYDKRLELFQATFNEAADKSIDALKYGDRTSSLRIQALGNDRRQQRENDSIILDNATNTARLAIVDHVTYLQERQEDDTCKDSILSLLKTLDEIIRIDAEGPGRVCNASEYMNALFWLQDNLLKYEPTYSSRGASTLKRKVNDILKPINETKNNPFLKSLDLSSLAGQVAEMEVALKNYEEDCSQKKRRAFQTTQLEQVKDHVQNITETKKAAFTQRMQMIKSAPDAEKRREKLAYFREREKLLRDRLYADWYCTFLLDSSGKIDCTTVTDDQFGNFDGGKSVCQQWKTQFIKQIYVNTYRVYAVTGDGKIIGTWPKRTIDSDTLPQISKWEKVKKYYNKGFFEYAVLEDGTVRVAGKLSEKLSEKLKIPYHGQDKVDSLYDVDELICISLGRLICRKKDGSMVATEYIGEGDDRSAWDKIAEWKDIVNLWTVSGMIFGLCADGTLLTAKYKEVEEDNSGWVEASSWTDIVDLFGWDERIIGISTYGDVLVTSYYGETPEDPKTTEAFATMSSWSNIACLYIEYGIFIGLTANGDVVKTNYFGDDKYYRSGQYDIENWHQIAGLAFGHGYTVGVRLDGTLIACSGVDEDHGQTNVVGKRMFKDYDQFPEEIEKALSEYQTKKEIEKKKRVAALNSEKSALSVKLPSLKGLFAGKRRKEIEARLAEIDRELSKLN